MSILNVLMFLLLVVMVYFFITNKMASVGGKRIKPSRYNVKVYNSLAEGADIIKSISVTSQDTVSSFISKCKSAFELQHYDYVLFNQNNELITDDNLQNQLSYANVNMSELYDFSLERVIKFKLNYGSKITSFNFLTHNNNSRIQTDLDLLKISMRHFGRSGKGWELVLKGIGNREIIIKQGISRFNLYELPHKNLFEIELRFVDDDSEIGFPRQDAMSMSFNEQDYDDDDSEIGFPRQDAMSLSYEM